MPTSLADAHAMRESLRSVYRRILATSTKGLTHFEDPETVGKCSAQLTILIRQLDKIQEDTANMIGRPLYAELLIENHKLRQSAQATQATQLVSDAADA